MLNKSSSALLNKKQITKKSAFRDQLNCRIVLTQKITQQLFLNQETQISFAERMQEPNSSIVRVSIDAQITLTVWRGKGVSDPVSILQRRLGDGSTSVHSRTSFL